LILGAIVSAIAMALAGITRTGVNGVYAFALLGGSLLVIFLMWPERRRFVVHRKATASKARDQQAAHAKRRRGRPRTL
jgi:hypothetical protein